jgi:RNA polymerase sigma-B factor
MPPTTHRARHAGAGSDRQLIQRHRSGDPRARTILIERYLPLARRLAQRYRDSSEPFDDLLQVASLGLVKAVDRWEPEQGYAFSSYAVPTIIGELRRYFRDSTWTVRPPRSVVELSLSIDRARQPLNAALGREPAPADFAGHLGRSPELVAEALQAAGCRSASSLDCELTGEGDSETFGDRLRTDERGYERAEAQAALESMVSILDHRAKEILRLRFGDDLLQAQIAERLGYSQVSVSRIIRTSIERLRAHALAPAT